MFRGKAPQVQIGDRFTKTGGGARKIWTVMGISDNRYVLPHARLASEGPSSESITISIRALADCALFLPFTPVPTVD